MILDIRKYGDPVLQEKTIKIKDPLDKEIQELIPTMFESMEKANGVGLAAPQIGINKRICVIFIPETEEKFVMINPQITAKSNEKIKQEEGCLSFPGEFYEIIRSEKVQVRYLDENGKKVKMKAEGLLARAIQHEIDHLDGILIIDRLKSK